MVRHAVFALVLVGAAFAGGAAIHGPGLAWLQRTLSGGPTIIVDGAPATAPAAKKPPTQFPAAKTPPLEVALARDEPARNKPAEPGPGGDLTAPPESPAAEFPPDPRLAQATPPRPTPAPASAPATPPAPEADPLPPLDLGPVPKSDPVARLASASSPSPAAQAPTASAPAPASSPTSAGDWGELRKRMKALGIARYSIEAETGGRVRFSCVIPVDGLRAVGHHFEAEGDDEYQAAEATLRRVALWRATAQN